MFFRVFRVFRVQGLGWGFFREPSWRLWVAISRVMNMVAILTTLLMTTHEPPSFCDVRMSLDPWPVALYCS